MSDPHPADGPDLTTDQVAVMAAFGTISATAIGHAPYTAIDDPGLHRIVYDWLPADRQAHADGEHRVDDNALSDLTIYAAGVLVALGMLEHHPDDRLGQRGVTYRLRASAQGLDLFTRRIRREAGVG